MTTLPLAAMLLMLAALAAACLVAPRGEDAGILAVAALMAAAAFAAVRNNALAAIALAVPLAYHADPALRRACAPEAPSPVGAAGFMAAHALAGNILGDYAWGRLPHLARANRLPGLHRQPLRDGLSARVQRDYLDFIRGGEGAAAVLAAYPTDYVIIPSDSAASRFMSAEPQWRMIYRDPLAALFARADSPAAHIAGVPMLREEAPASFFPKRRRGASGSRPLQALSAGGWGCCCVRQ